MRIFHTVSIIAIWAGNSIISAGFLQTKACRIASRYTSPHIVILCKIGRRTSNTAYTIASRITECSLSTHIHTQIQPTIIVAELGRIS